MVFFAALTLLTLKIGANAPLGNDVVVQAYFRLLSPASSKPRTQSCTVVPVTGLEAAVAATDAIGGLFLIVKFIVLFNVPLIAVTVAAPGVPGAT